MRKLNFVMLLIFFTSAVYGQTNTVQQRFKKLDWLAGTWNRINTKPDRTGIEIWEKQSAEKFIGKGISLKGADTAFVEKLQLIIKGTDIFYVADVPGNNGATNFKMTSVTDSSFVCENPEHDFPKKIAYTYTDGKLKAIVSGDGKELNYLFVRKESTPSH